jgi:hypothetical protein
MLSSEGAKASLIVPAFSEFVTSLTERGPDFRTTIRHMYTLSLQSMIQG